MSVNYTVSSDVDTMLRSTTNAQIRSNIGAGSETQVNTNASNIASVGSSVDTNTANIATNTSNITTNAGNIATNTSNISTLQTAVDDKAPKNNATFTGTTNFNGAADFNNAVTITDNVGITGEVDLTGDLKVVGDFELSKTAPSITLQDTNNQFGQDSEDLTTIKNTSGVTSITAGADVSAGNFPKINFKIDGASGNSVHIASDGKIGVGTTGGWGTHNTSGPSEALDVHGNINVGGTSYGNITASGTGIVRENLTVGNIDQSGGSGNILASGNITGSTISGDKLITNEIQCKGELPSGSDAQPINYDANVHRFRDFDETPTNLFVIEKHDGFTGARIGINKEPSSDNTVALHVVAGKNASTNVFDTALKVIGDSFFENSIRIGHYTDSTRPSPQVGMIIYNRDHHEFQGYLGDGMGWRKFNMSPIST